MTWLKWCSVLCAGGAAVVLAGALLFWNSTRPDDQGPEISMDSELVVISTEEDESAILQGITAWDVKDGDVTDSLAVADLSHFTAQGERIAQIVAFDKENNATQVERRVQYTDYEKPVFRLTGPLSIGEGGSFSGVSSRLSAYDCVDGDVTGLIRYSLVGEKTFDSKEPGIYPVKVSVTNTAGDTEEFVASVEVYDTLIENLPSVRLTHAMVYLEQGEAFDPLKYILRVSADGVPYTMEDGQLVNETWDSAENLSPDDFSNVGTLMIQNPVNVEVPGWYEVGYTVALSSGVERTAFLLVRVTE